MPTRAQQRMTKAYEDVSGVKDGLTDATQVQRYGGLCHKVPVMIRTCGLCQTISFMESKKAKEKSHERMLAHIAGVLGLDAATLAEGVAKLPTPEYMMKTRLLLEALVYYKRFAVSILNAEPDSDRDEGAS